MSVTRSRRPARVALVAAVTLSSWAVWQSGPAGASGSAKGATCTVVGTAKADVLVGTSGKDVICGLGGNDTIDGRGGDDTIDGGAGDDRLTGGAGNDTISGGDGDDTLIGGAGNDSMAGNAGSDTVSYADHTAAVTADLDGVRDDGSAGETDLITTSVENLVGGPGGDTLTGSSGANTISGGDGDDTLSGGSGSDRINGGNGNDKIRGGADPDTLDGGWGTNVCDGDGADTTVVRCPADSTAPAPRSYAVSKNKVDTSAAAQTVTVTTRVTDDFSGVASVTVQLVGPATYVADAALRSGNASDGTFEAVVSIPKDAPAGSYALYVGAADTAGNTLAPKKTPLTVEQIGAGDKAAPVLTSWKAAPTTIDTSEAAADVTVTAVVSDAGSGVSSVTAKLVGPATYTQAATLKDAATGTYEAVVHVPQGAPVGSYKLVIASADAKGNAGEKETTTVVTNSVGGTSEGGGTPAPEPGGADTTAPFVKSWQVTPTEIDTDEYEWDVTVTSRVTDGGSGVVSVLYRLVGPGGATYSKTVTERQSGTAADGTYSGDVTVPEGAPLGNYTLYIGAADAAGNELAPATTNVVVKNVH